MEWMVVRAKTIAIIQFIIRFLFPEMNFDRDVIYWICTLTKTQFDTHSTPLTVTGATASAQDRCHQYY